MPLSLPKIIRLTATLFHAIGPHEPCRSNNFGVRLSCRCDHTVEKTKDRSYPGSMYVIHHTARLASGREHRKPIYLEQDTEQ